MSDAKADPWPKLALVTCSASKLPGRHPARLLYQPSRLFQLCVEAVETDGLPFVIISSLYGIVLPDQELDSYERDLKALSSEQRQEWLALVDGQLRALVADHGVREAVFLAGADYRSPVKPLLNELGVRTLIHRRWDAICDAAFGRT